ncbi:transmembrane protein, putative [Medicago truncatula]|uniref:Transmembrane protein, putative n=1 Tax=Medicago truncatula TaxID=3880 RepID=G7KYT9_MEDTR|nr:transmembrane protein, putative [Medicago truncatula]
MNIGPEKKKDGDEDPSPFSWFTVFCAILSAATLVMMASFKFSSQNNGWFQLLPTTHSLGEDDEIHTYETRQCIFNTLQK